MRKVDFVRLKIEKGHGIGDGRQEKLVGGMKSGCHQLYFLHVSNYKRIIFFLKKIQVYLSCALTATVTQVIYHSMDKPGFTELLLRVPQSF